MPSTPKSEDGRIPLPLTELNERNDELRRQFTRRKSKALSSDGAMDNIVFRSTGVAKDGCI
jgi:hypothetical protein